MIMHLKKYIDIINLAESAREQLKQESLDYSREDLAPILSKETLDYHYGKLARGYVDRYNKKEGNDSFNYGGAILHNLYFPQLMPPRASNRPVGTVKEVIDTKWKSFDKFKEEFSLEFMKAQGSNWIYMDSKGNIKVIHNHEYNKGMDIALIIDGWEHAWALDYQHDKQKYLDNTWRIINWSVVNQRLDNQES
jgi:Fe-Mn family superoxide dismutase